MTQNMHFLNTKCSISPVRSDILSRPHLYERLQLLYGYRLTLLLAPAGFGKTTLLSTWSLYNRAEKDSSLIAWLSLDTNDNDDIRFWSYTIAALATQVPDLGLDALKLLNRQEPSSIEDARILLLNDMAALPQKIVLIFDDYHLIEAPSIHANVELLLDCLPQNTHIVMTSRTLPPLPLARLRARGQLYELGLSDIRFTPQEAANFLNGSMQLTLSANTLATLESRIEGWIAGWYLAALALREANDVADFVAQFTGNHRYIIDYLVEEVLRHQSTKIQTFLLQTCILERMDASLCDAVTGGTTGQQMLLCLEQAQLFILPQDNIRHWYRYHTLFAEALRSQLQQLHPQWPSRLHLRASQWYEAHDLLIEAIDHALLATDYDQAIVLIKKIAQTTSTIWMRNGFSPLHRWLTILPPTFLRKHPQLRILYAWKLFSSLLLDPSIKLEAVETWIHDAEQDLEQADEDPQKQAMRGEIAAILAFTALLRGNTSQCTDYGQQALRLLPDDNIAIRGFAAQTLINNHAVFGNAAATIGIPEELLRICQATHDPIARMNALCSIAQLHKMHGQLHQAAEIYRLAQEPSELLLKPTVSGTLALEFGTLLLEWNALDAAEQALATGLEQCKEGGDPGTLRNGYLGLARLRRIQGDIDGAFAALAEIELLFHKFHMLSQHAFGKLLLSDVAASRAQLYLIQGNMGEVNRWMQTCKPIGNEEPTSLRQHELCIRARVYLVNQQFEECLHTLTSPLKTSAPSVENRITLLLIQASALYTRKDRELALQAITRALILAEPGGYVRIFLDEGPLVADMLENLHDTYLRKQPSNHVSLPYLRQLLADFAPRTSIPATSIPSAPQANAFRLSKREMEVLRLLATGLADREIAVQLVLAEGTVKTHAKRIYAKLGIQNRTQAALYAKELRLL